MRDSMDWYQDVLDFHRKFCPDLIGTTPRIPPPGIDFLRYGLMGEEFAEFRRAWSDNNMPALADALADLVYVSIGCAITYGIDLRPVWGAVHAANMRKEGGGLRPDGKVMKPPGWEPPDVARILASQGPIGAGG